MASYSTTLRNSRQDEITALVDAGTGAGKVKVYDGAVPANVGTALSGQTLLAQGTLSDPSAAAASGGVWTASSITADASADATGTPTFARITDSDDNDIIQLTVGTSGTELIINTATITASQEVQFTSLTITAGNV